MKIQIACVAVIFFLGCSKSSSTSSGGQTSGLDGTWTSACTGDTSSSTKEVLVISGGSYNTTMTAYDSNNCASGTERAIFRSTSSGTIGAAATTPEGATKLDLSNIRLFITPKNDGFVSDNNRDSNYGYNDWVKNKEKEVTGKTIDGAEDGQNKTYTIFKITGNTVCFGTNDGEKDGSNDTKRHVILETGSDCLKR
jgi:hypothetical protein